jgi:putative oxygen-independent coproporphyrinogen III oxidase
VHVPFCPQICPYCDFHKMLRDDGLVEAYLDRMEQEIRVQGKRYPGRLDTVYFGGGTPSALGDEELRRLTTAIDEAWGFPGQLETTLEADPLTFDPARLEFFGELGFSRLSIGLQSTQDAVLKRLGRLHDGAAGLEAVRWALAAGFEVSADLMTAVPGQDSEADLRALADTGVPHVSVYTLTIEPHTPFARRGMTVDEDRAADDFDLATTVLGEYGLERYEVSSHARLGHESRHNQVYWDGRHFMAVGPSAAAFLPRPGTPGARVANPVTKPWLAGAEPQVELLTPVDYTLERLMTGLRTRAGVDLADVRQRAGIDVEDSFRDVLAPLVRHGLLVSEAGRLRATPDGLIRLDAILREFFAARPAEISTADSGPGESTA